MCAQKSTIRAGGPPRPHQLQGPGQAALPSATVSPSVKWEQPAPVCSPEGFHTDSRGCFVHPPLPRAREHHQRGPKLLALKYSVTA